MPSSSTLLACVISFLGFAAVSASPLGARGSCSPNFEGAPLIVTLGGSQWGVSSPAVDSNVINTPHGSSSEIHFRFEQTGTPSPSYLIKLADNNPSNQLVVAANAHGPVKVANINWSGNDPTQTWNVVCNTCSTNIADSSGQVATACYIQLKSTGECAQLGANPGQGLSLASCSGSASQTYDFSTA